MVYIFSAGKSVVAFKQQASAKGKTFLNSPKNPVHVKILFNTAAAAARYRRYLRGALREKGFSAEQVRTIRNNKKETFYVEPVLLKGNKMAYVRVSSHGVYRSPHESIEKAVETVKELNKTGVSIAVLPSKLQEELKRPVTLSIKALKALERPSRLRTKEQKIALKESKNSVIDRVRGQIGL